MQKFLLASTLVMGGALLVGDLGAHGGTYRGPGDTVPPGAGGDAGGGEAPLTGPIPGSGTSPVPGTGVGPLGPTTSPGGGPLGTGSGTTTYTGPQLTTDLSQWSFWWEFNKDGFLNLREALDERVVTGEIGYWLGDGMKSQARTSVRPSRSQIEEDIVPALLETLEQETNKDIVTGCLIALAKIGDRVDESGTSQFQETFTGFLSHANQEIRETAAIALGILANPSSLDLLEALVFNRELGQRAVASNEVDLRTRAYAAYGLGLVGARNDDPEVRQRIVTALLEALPMTHGLSTPDVGVAVVSSLGLVPLDAVPAPLEADAAVITIPQQIEALLEYFENPRHDRFVRAHVPTAVGRLFTAYEAGASEEDTAQLKAQLAPALLLPLDPKRGRYLESEVRMASALALGLIGDADDEDLDGEIRDALIGAADDPLRQVRKFALIGLAKSAARPGQDEAQTARGRSETVDYLIRNMERGRSGVERWAGIAAGVYAFQLNAAGESAPSALYSSLSKQLQQA
ncbi:MAG: HEAT repeat domain-containing protein, partial [Planctomycetota bacterium]